MPHLVLAGWGLAAPCLPLKRVGVEIGVLGIPGPAPQDAHLGAGQEREGVGHELGDHHSSAGLEATMEHSGHGLAMFVQLLGPELAAALDDVEDLELELLVVVIANQHPLLGRNIGADHAVLYRAERTEVRLVDHAPAISVREEHLQAIGELDVLRTHHHNSSDPPRGSARIVYAQLSKDVAPFYLILVFCQS